MVSDPIPLSKMCRSENINLFMQMQSFGQPPVDIVNDLAPGLPFEEIGLPGDAGSPCCIQ